MIIDYPVQLFPKRAMNPDGSDNLASPGESFFAVVSENKILVRGDSPARLGVNYRVYVNNLSLGPDAVRVLSYDIPPDSELHTGKGIFQVRALGTHKNDFIRGELFSLEKKLGSAHSLDRNSK